MADLRAVPGGAEDTSDCDRWCLNCKAIVVWQAVSERWVHEKEMSPRCDPYNRLETAEANPAPEGMRLVRRTRTYVAGDGQPITPRAGGHLT